MTDTQQTSPDVAFFTVQVSVTPKDLAHILSENADSVSLAEYKTLISVCDPASLPFDMVLACILPYGIQDRPDLLQVILEKVPLVLNGKIQLGRNYANILDISCIPDTSLVLLDHILKTSDADFAVIKEELLKRPSRVMMFNSVQDTHPEILAKFFVRVGTVPHGIKNVNLLTVCAEAGIFHRHTETVVKALLEERMSNKTRYLDLQKELARVKESHRQELGRMYAVQARLERQADLDTYTIKGGRQPIIFTNYNNHYINNMDCF